MKQEFVHYVGQLLRLKEKELIIAQNTEAFQEEFVSVLPTTEFSPYY